MSDILKETDLSALLSHSTTMCKAKKLNFMHSKCIRWLKLVVTRNLFCCHMNKRFWPFRPLSRSTHINVFPTYLKIHYFPPATGNGWFSTAVQEKHSNILGFLLMCDQIGCVTRVCIYVFILNDSIVFKHPVAPIYQLFHTIYISITNATKGL
jgi:hypothetical protein